VTIHDLTPTLKDRASADRGEARESAEVQVAPAAPIAQIVPTDANNKQKQGRT
jgi:hypothetical protein